MAMLEEAERGEGKQAGSRVKSQGSGVRGSSRYASEGFSFALIVYNIYTFIILQAMISCDSTITVFDRHHVTREGLGLRRMPPSFAVVLEIN